MQSGERTPDAACPTQAAGCGQDRDLAEAVGMGDQAGDIGLLVGADVPRRPVRRHEARKRHRGIEPGHPPRVADEGKELQEVGRGRRVLRIPTVGGRLFHRRAGDGGELFVEDLAIGNCPLRLPEPRPQPGAGDTKARVDEDQSDLSWRYGAGMGANAAGSRRAGPHGTVARRSTPPLQRIDGGAPGQDRRTAWPGLPRRSGLRHSGGRTRLATHRRMEVPITPASVPIPPCAVPAARQP